MWMASFVHTTNFWRSTARLLQSNKSSRCLLRTRGPSKMLKKTYPKNRREGKNIFTFAFSKIPMSHFSRSEELRVQIDAVTKESGEKQSQILQHVSPYC